MQSYRCKCGKELVHTTMGVAACLVSSCCRTTFAQHPEGHHLPEPHKFVTRYNPLSGAPYEVCTACLRQRGDIESEDAAAAS